MIELINNKYYICLNQNKEPIAWTKFNDEQMSFTDYKLEYFDKVFQAIENNLKKDGLIFYLTENVHELPSYGENVVAIVLADEWCRIPVYSHKVKAIFKCYGIRPILGCNPLLYPSYLNFIALLQFIRIWIIRLPYSLNYVFHKLKNVNKIPPIYDIPLGYYKQLNLPVKDIETRLYDVFFAGSTVNIPYPIWSLKYWLGTPKNISRNQMISSLRQIKEKCSNLKIELTVTSGFHDTKNEDARSYSEKMMDTKICLVPRGTSFETFRFFEGMRYGCILITEALPPRWFYMGSPAIQVKDWQELEEIIKELTTDKSLIQKKHQESLNWWHTKCSETALGKYMAEKLNELTQSSS